MNLKLLIADDELQARQLIIHYLHEAGFEAEIHEASDGRDAIEMLNKTEPDILFLDIKMPEADGIEVLKNKNKGLLPVVIFTTAYDEYALPAFDLEALDYLVKPFGKERFEKAMNRAIDYISFIKNQTRPEYLTSIPLKKGTKTDLIPIEQVEYFQSEGTYVRVHTAAQSFLISDPVYELETRLNPQTFIRIHRSVIVNKRFIRSVNSLLNGDHRVILTNDKELRASRTYRDHLKKLKNLPG